MKTLKLLATLLLVALSTGFISCKKEFIDGPNYSIIGVDTDKEFANYGITDFKDIEMRSCFGLDSNNVLFHEVGQANFAGLRNNHLWIASFDRDTKQKLVEWTDNKGFERTRRINLGYGEYKDITISDITLYQTYSIANSFVAFIQLEKDNYSEVFHIFKTPTSFKELKELNGFIVEWYKESIAIGDCCYTMAGDTIFVTKNGARLNGMAQSLISYKEEIRTYNDTKGFYIAKRNHELGEDIWRVEVKELSNEPSNAKIEVRIINNSTNVWEYKVNVTHYDGTKKEHTFKINIETGKLVSDEIKVTGISLNTATGEIEIGGTYELTATISPTGATNPNITWKSSDDRIATVNDKGLVTAISEGTATITATTEDGGFTAQAIIQVLSSRRIIHIKSDDYDISLGYSNDKLSSYIWKYTHGDYDFNQNIAYKGNTVTISGKADGDECVQTYKLNKNGYATSCTVSDDDGKSIDISFEYSQEGYLTKAIEITKYNSETKSNAYTFTYSTNRNILKGSESNISGHIYTQSYGNVKNKSGIMDYAMSELLFNYQAAFYCGILGKSCTHLPSSCKETEVYEMGWSKTYEFIYAQDDSGYVTKTTIANSGGEAETLTYTYK